jgi:hypothetical protein
MCLMGLQYTNQILQMTMKIDFENANLISYRKWYKGELETGESFTIDAEWNNWDGWMIIEVMQDEGEINEKKEEEIKNYFLEEIYNW